MKKAGSGCPGRPKFQKRIDQPRRAYLPAAALSRSAVTPAIHAGRDIPMIYTQDGSAVEIRSRQHATLFPGLARVADDK